MAAMRSALAILGRRSCVSSGSSAAASMGGRGLEIHHPAAPRMPSRPSLRPAAVRNLENFQRFSTGKECVDPKKSPLMTDKADSVLNMLGRWSKDSLRNVKEADPAKVLCVSTAITTVTSIYLTIWSLESWNSQTW